MSFLFGKISIGGGLVALIIYKMEPGTSAQYPLIEGWLVFPCQRARKCCDRDKVCV